jgi:hypothetical protein
MGVMGVMDGVMDGVTNPVDRTDEQSECTLTSSP